MKEKDKIGTITISVFKTDNFFTSFEIKTDKNGKSLVYINDKPLEERYIRSEYYEKPCTQDMLCGPFIIPEHKYFMMGDNRGNSYDSRWWGFLPEDRFVGRAVLLFWPFNRVKVFGNLK